MAWPTLLIYLALTLTLNHVFCEWDMDTKQHLCYGQQEDLNIALFTGLGGPIATPSHLKCGPNVDSAWKLILSQSFLYALEQVNSQSDILPNITLGFAILDTCFLDLTALADMMYLVPTTNIKERFPNKTPLYCEDGWKHFEVVGAVGPPTSRSAVMLGGVSSIFQIPLLLTFASSDELSDKTRFAYTLRLVPPDRFQAEAMVDLLVHLGWSYISLLYKEGAYGENGGKQIEKNARRRGICIAFHYMITFEFSPTEVREVTNKLRLYKAAKVVIAFIEIQHLEKILELLKEDGLERHFIWFGSDSIHFDSVSDSIQPLIDGSLSTTFTGKDDPEFREYFKTVTPDKYPLDPFIRSAWEQLYDCAWNKSLGNASCYALKSEPNYFTGFDGYESKQIDAVWVYAYALHALISQYCPGAFRDKTLLQGCVTGQRLYKIMLQVEFYGLGGHIKFDWRGDFQGTYDYMQYQSKSQSARKFGIWSKQTSSLEIETELLTWFDQSENMNDINRTIPDSLCSYPCGEKEYYILKELHCCWECRTCRSNEILVGNKTGCAVCGILTWPDEKTSTECVLIKPQEISLTSAMVITIISVICLGLVVCVTVGALFVKNHQNKLVKASSRQLMAIILLGIIVAYLTALLLLLPPSSSSCYLSRFGFHLSVTLIYAPLMVKTARIYRIFSAGKRGNTRPALVGTKSQLIIVTLMIVLQISICVVSATLAPPIPLLKQQVPTEKYVESVCDLPLSGLMPPLSLNLLFISICALFGFLTRKLPANFNESWYIFVSIATTTFLWVVFLPAYFTAFYSAHQVVLLACCLIFNGSVTLLCLYVPKVYCIYFVSADSLQIQTAGTIGTTSVATTSAGN